jgi:hypothetical protein
MVEESWVGAAPNWWMSHLSPNRPLSVAPPTNLLFASVLLLRNYVATTRCVSWELSRGPKGAILAMNVPLAPAYGF